MLPALPPQTQIVRNTLQRVGFVRRVDPKIERARTDFTAFCELIWRNYERAPHLDMLNAELMRLERVYSGVESGEHSLMVEMPPRHGKSQTVAVLFPAWFLGRHPDTRIIMTSYGARLVERHSRKIRNILRQPIYGQIFPGVLLSEDSQAKNAWNLAAPHEGGLEAVGKGGAVTGFGAHLLITDDLVKNRKEAESEVFRDSDWDWLQDDLMTRKETGAIHVAIGTRWQLDDVHGRIRRNIPDDWRYLLLPALAEANDPLGRSPGEALWPSRFDVEYLQKRRRDMGDYSYLAEYQQRPQATEGGLFKRAKIQIIDSAPPDIRRWVRFWDLAASSSTRADYTCGLRLGETTDGRLIVTDVVRRQIDWDEVPDLIESVAIADGESVPVGIEKAFIQARAVQKVQMKPSMRRFRVTGYPVDADKFVRALDVAARVGEGLLYVLRRAWTDAFLEELAGFPTGDHDDQVDALSGAYLAIDVFAGATTKKRKGIG